MPVSAVSGTIPFRFFVVCIDTRDCLPKQELMRVDIAIKRLELVRPGSVDT
jgi:hypothetical protein